MKRAVLVLKRDSKSSVTNDIIGYLEENLEQLIRRFGIVFEYQLVSDVYKGIRKCPTLVYNGQRIEGQDILSFFHDLGSKARPSRQQPTDIQDYFDNLIQNTDPENVDEQISAQKQEACNAWVASRKDSQPSSSARPGKYASLIATLEGRKQPQQQELVPDVDYQQDYADMDPGAPADEWRAYAMEQCQSPMM